VRAVTVPNDNGYLSALSFGILDQRLCRGSLVAADSITRATVGSQ